MLNTVRECRQMYKSTSREVHVGCIMCMCMHTKDG